MTVSPTARDRVRRRPPPERGPRRRASAARRHLPGVRASLLAALTVSVATTSAGCGMFTPIILMMFDDDSAEQRYYEQLSQSDWQRISERIKRISGADDDAEADAAAQPEASEEPDIDFVILGGSPGPSPTVGSSLYEGKGIRISPGPPQGPGEQSGIPRVTVELGSVQGMGCVADVRPQGDPPEPTDPAPATGGTEPVPTVKVQDTGGGETAIFPPCEPGGPWAISPEIELFPSPGPGLRYEVVYADDQVQPTGDEILQHVTESKFAIMEVFLHPLQDAGDDRSTSLLSRAGVERIEVLSTTSSAQYGRDDRTRREEQWARWGVEAAERLVASLTRRIARFDAEASQVRDDAARPGDRDDVTFRLADGSGGVPLSLVNAGKTRDLGVTGEDGIAHVPVEEVEEGTTLIAYAVTCDDETRIVLVPPDEEAQFLEELYADCEKRRLERFVWYAGEVFVDVRGIAQWISYARRTAEEETEETEEERTEHTDEDRTEQTEPETTTDGSTWGDGAIVLTEDTEDDQRDEDADEEEREDEEDEQRDEQREEEDEEREQDERRYETGPILGDLPIMGSAFLNQARRDEETQTAAVEFSTGVIDVRPNRTRPRARDDALARWTPFGDAPWPPPTRFVAMPAEDDLRSPRTNPDVFIHITSLGVSTGDAFRVTVVNRGPRPVSLEGRALVLEPIALGPEEARRLEAEAEAEAAEGDGGTATVTATGYCLQFQKAVPPEGMVFRIAGASAQAEARPVRRMLEAARELYEAGAFHPDSDPEAYFHSILQWAIWTLEQGFRDVDEFREAFVEQTARNVRNAGHDWTPEMERATADLAPNRWRDVQVVLRAAEG